MLRAEVFVAKASGETVLRYSATAQVGGKPPTESWWRRLLRKLGLG